MAEKNKFYGAGSHVSNPFFPTEETYEGKGRTLISPHGSAFDYSIDTTNEMDRRLDRARALPGSFKKSSEVMGK